MGSVIEPQEQIAEYVDLNSSRWGLYALFKGTNSCLHLSVKFCFGNPWIISGRFRTY